MSVRTHFFDRSSKDPVSGAENTKNESGACNVGLDPGNAFYSFRLDDAVRVNSGWMKSCFLFVVSVYAPADCCPLRRKAISTGIYLDYSLV